MSPPPKLSRRSLTLGGIGVAVAAVVAGAVYEVPRLFKHRVSGEYADLVNLLDEPDQAAIVGRAVAGDNLREAAVAIRVELKEGKLPALLAHDVAGNALTEADGWVLPATLATLCAMAAV